MNVMNGIASIGHFQYPIVIALAMLYVDDLSFLVTFVYNSVSLIFTIRALCFKGAFVVEIN